MPRLSLGSFGNHGSLFMEIIGNGNGLGLTTTTKQPSVCCHGMYR